MRLTPTRQTGTIREAVSLHYRTRSKAARLRRYSRQPWSFLLHPVVRYYGMRETRALKALVALKPGKPEEARDKLLYLMALMTSNATAFTVSEVEHAIHTLRPFRPDLAKALGNGAPGAGDELGEGSPLLPEVSRRTAPSRN